MSGLTEVIARRDLLVNLVRAELSARYRSASLGLLWFLLTPLILMVVLTVIFGYVIDLGIPNYPVFIFAGLLPYTFFQVALLNATSSVSRASGLIKRSQMPRLYLPLAAIGGNLIHYLISLLLLVPLMVLFNVPFTPALLLMPLAVLMAVAAVTGLGLLTSGLNVAHRDVELMLSAATRVLFYLSPVLYPLSLVPDEWRGVYMLNPIVGVIEMHRSLLLNGTLPSLDVLIVSLAVISILLVLGFAVFTRREMSFEDYV